MIDVVVTNSEICVSWNTSDYDRGNLWPFYAHARRITVAIVDLIAFREGFAAAVILDRFREDTGFEDGISFRVRLESVCQRASLRSRSMTEAA
jgi:hypothetical protein